MEKQYKSVTSQAFNITAMMNAFDLALVDVVDANVVIRDSRTGDAAPVYEKRLGLGVNIVEGFTANGVTYPFALIADFEFADYGKTNDLIQEGKQYFMGVGIKVSGDTDWREFPLSDDRINILCRVNP